jgi:hypothetical protein
MVVNIVPRADLAGESLQLSQGEPTVVDVFGNFECGTTAKRSLWWDQECIDRPRGPCSFWTRRYDVVRKGGGRKSTISDLQY